jgi:hypothetical protein
MAKVVIDITNMPLFLPYDTQGLKRDLLMGRLVVESATFESETLTLESEFESHKKGLDSEYYKSVDGACIIIFIIVFKAFYSYFSSYSSSSNVVSIPIASTVNDSS